MARETHLEVLNFCVREKNEKDFFKLSDLPGSEDFLLFIEQYLDYIHNDLELNDENFTALKLKEDTLKINREKRIIRGVFESGAYGSERQVINILSKKRKTVSKNEVVVQPFYFLIALPKNSERGIFMLQRIGNDGISTIVKRSTVMFFKKKYNDLKLDFFPYLSDEIIKDFTKKGKVSEIIFTRKHLPKDTADKLGLKDFKEEIQSVEYRIKAKRNSFFDNVYEKIYSYSKNRQKSFLNKSIANSIGLDGEEEIRIRSNYNDSTRVIDLTDSLKLKPYYRILEIKEDEDGNASFASIDTYAYNLYKEIVKK